MPSSDQIAQAAGFSRAARSLGIQIEHVQRRHCFRMTPTSRRRRAERCPQPLTAISLLDDVQLRGTRIYPGEDVHNKRLDGQGGQRAIASDETQTPDRCTHLAYITALSLRALFQCSGAAAGDDCGSRTVSVERCESSNRTLGFSDLVQMD